MTIEFKKETFFHAIWFCGGYPGGQGEDWLAAIFKEEGKQWKGVYRFRYHNSNDPWDETDTKNWYEITQGDPNDDAFVGRLVQTFDMLFGLCQRRYDHPGTKLDVLGDGEKAMELLRQQPWAFTKPMTEIEGKPLS